MDVSDLRVMFAGIDEETKDVILRKLKPELSQVVAGINNYIVSHKMTKAMLCPPIELTMEALRKCGGISKVRVVLIGQDPYIKAGEAMGLSFSVPRAAKVPPSLKNIYKCLLRSGLIATMPDHGDLTEWAKQGVLLLNCALSTVLGRSNAHAKIWERYTNALIRELSALPRRLIFILLGAFAQQKASLIDKDQHSILTWSHPSPLNTANQNEANVGNFIYCNVFTKTNDILKELYDSPIDWDPNHIYVARVIDLPSDSTAVEQASNTQVGALSPIVDASEQLNYPTYNDGEAASRAASVVNSSAHELSTRESPPYIVLGAFGPCDALPLTISTLWIFTDGASRANGMANCKSSWAFYITDGYTCGRANGKVAECHVAGKVYKSSNNRGELTAIYQALLYMSHAHDTALSFSDVVVVSDSMYCIDTLNKWVAGWLADPIGKDLKAKKNTDIIIPAYRLLTEARDKYPVVFRHCRSHQPEPSDVESEAWFIWKGNDIVDKLATSVLE